MIKIIITLRLKLIDVALYSLVVQILLTNQQNIEHNFKVYTNYRHVKEERKLKLNQQI